MTCDIKPETYVGYVFGELDTEQVVTFENHLKTCSVCQAEISELNQMHRVMNHWEDQEPPFQLTFVGEPAAEKHWKQNLFGFIKNPVAAWAIPVVAILLFAVFNMRVVYQNGSMVVYFGKSMPEMHSAAAVNATQVQSMQMETLQMVQQMIQASEVHQARQTANQMTRFAQWIEARRQRDLMLVGQGLEDIHFNTLSQYQQTHALLSDLIQLTHDQDTLQ